MSVSLNKVVIAGNLTRDIEPRYSSGGMCISGFSLAVNERKKKGEEWVEDVVYVDVTAFGKMAERCAEHLSKGSCVIVDGRLQLERWESDGQKRQKLSVIANDVRFVSGWGRDKGGNAGGPPAGASSAPSGDAPPPF